MRRRVAHIVGPGQLIGPRLFRAKRKKGEAGRPRGNVTGEFCQWAGRPASRKVHRVRFSFSFLHLVPSTPVSPLKLVIEGSLL